MDILQKLWAFYVALYMTTHMETTYCDVCIRIFRKYTVDDFHLLSTTVHDQNMGDNIFNTSAKAVDALYLDWSEKIIGVSLDGMRRLRGDTRA